MGTTKKRLPCPDKNKDWHKHLPKDIPDSPTKTALSWDVCDRHGALYEAYKKHSGELRAIEDGENKLLLLILAIFGAGVTAASKVDLRCHLFLALYFTAIALALVVAAIHVVNENHDLRIVVRDLLVQCEQAMEFYARDIFLKDDSLYQDAERHYACKGQHLRDFSRWVILGAGIFLIPLIWYSFARGPLVTSP